MNIEILGLNTGILTAKENLALKNSDDNGADHAGRDLEALLNLWDHF